MARQPAAPLPSNASRHHGRGDNVLAGEGGRNVKVLTVQQPFAALLVLGIKDVENRTWRTSYRGQLAIHASKDSARSNFDVIHTLTPSEESRWAYSTRLHEGGAILGCVWLVDIVGPPQRHISKWANPEPGTFHWVVRDAIASAKPVPLKGRLGLWDLPAGVFL